MENEYIRVLSLLEKKYPANKSEVTVGNKSAIDKPLFNDITVG